MIGDLILRGRSERLRAHEAPLVAEFDAPATTLYATAFIKALAGRAMQFRQSLVRDVFSRALLRGYAPRRRKFAAF
jgi:hypothetical protein